MNRYSHGFTLIEMMVALFLSMIFVGPLYIITRDLNAQADAQQKNVEAMQQARTGLALLSEDLRRTALGASPHPATDFLSVTRRQTTSSAFNRRSVVHFNRNQAGFDSIMLVGNFLGSETYQARALDNQFAVMLGTNSTPDDCLRQFSPDYSYVHVYGPKNVTVELQVTDAVYTAGVNLCTVTVNAGDMNEEAFSSGDEVWLMANQAVLYQVEELTVTDVALGCNVIQNQLVRYFVDYSEGNCTTNTLINSDTEETRQVIADYITDFQVWFRPVTPRVEGTTTRLVLNQSTLQTVFATTDTLVRAKEDHYIPAAINGTVNANDLSCNGAISTYGPEHVRSALVQVSVRGETPELRLDYRPFMIDPTADWDETSVDGRLAMYSIAPYEDGQCLQRPGTAYKVKTLITDVLMPNLAARSDMLANY